MKPSLRKPAGIIAMLGIITGWTVLIISVVDYIGAWPFAAQAIFYLFAGIAWIIPLRPLLAWMETGRFR